jgi:hypothetical protein
LCVKRKLLGHRGISRMLLLPGSGEGEDEMRLMLRRDDRKGICGYCKDLCAWDGKGTECSKST